ncbi:MAG: hypothetical protein L6R39_001869 [Caloplaca ligustica]|nr:MAG: hypothetical protein L6R39_001869 [Caloplaca ligustica]
MTSQGILEDPSTSSSHGTIFQRIESYPFATDLGFQSGLSTILSSSPSQDPELLTLRARCFYFSRKQKMHVDFNSYLSWRSAQNLLPVTTTAQDAPPSRSETDAAPLERASSEDSGIEESTQGGPQAPYPSSFAQIVNLITKGESIPGIKEIPGTVLEGQESAATAPKRKKPWEKDELVV